MPTPSFSQPHLNSYIHALYRSRSNARFYGWIDPAATGLILHFQADSPVPCSAV